MVRAQGSIRRSLSSHAALEFDMDRFFSKLDLRDIKIDPEHTRFSPDEELTAEEPRDKSSAVREESPVWHESADTTSTATLEVVAEERRNDPFPPLDGELSEVLKVSSKSRPSAVAGAIAGVVRELGRAEVQAIGAGATNQAIKAVAIARDYLQESGIDAVCLPAFIDITIDNEDRTAIRLVIEPR
jgi:stage V sporulation protein S